MQLDKVVSYHKALADPTRIKMLILLAEGELNGQVLAEKIGVTPATITHHAAKLREASLIKERRDKNTIYFSLNDYFIENSARATEKLIYQRVRPAGVPERLEEDDQRTRDAVVNNFSLPMES